MYMYMCVCVCVCVCRCVKNTGLYGNTQRDNEAQRLIKHTETVTQRCNSNRKTFFFLFVFS